MSNVNSIEFPLSHTLEQSLLAAHDLLVEFIDDPDFSQKTELVFGTRVDIESAKRLVQEFAGYDFSTPSTVDRESINTSVQAFILDNFPELPKIKIITGTEIKGARGAFSPFSLSIAPQKATSVGSGDYRIDSLLGGYKWGVTTISYSFYSGGSYYGDETGLASVSNGIKSSVRAILQNAIAPLINVNFVEVSDSATSYGQIRYLLSNSPDYAYAYYPFSTDANQFNSNDVAGDVFFNPSYDNTFDTNGFQGGPGTHGYETIIHETLHALGIKHPGNYNGSGAGDPPYLPYNQDNWDNTLMTYNFYSGAEPSTPMAYDVLALQYLYGAKSFNSSNTTYTFTHTDLYSDGLRTVGSSTLDNKVTIWDSGGIDTLNFAGLSSFSTGYRFDLNAGGWLSTQNAFNGIGYNVSVGPPVSYTDGTTYRATSYGTRLAYGVTIENLVNSSSNDQIIANSAANRFSGYGLTATTGNDTIEGANNLDTLDLSAFASASVTQTQSGNNLVLGLGSRRSVTIKDYYLASSGSRINLQFSGVTSAPTLAIAATNANQTEGNSGTKAFTFTITRAVDTSGINAVNWVVTGSGTSPANTSDFSGRVLPSGTVSFAAGETSKVITVNVLGDTTVEPDENFTVTLSNPTNGATITNGQGIGTIVNDDTAVIPTLAINDISITEGNSGTTNATFTVTLSAAATSKVTVNYATLNGLATAPSDYTAGSGTVTFTPGQTSKTITVSVVGDTVVEPNETFFLNLFNSTNATIADGQGIGTIVNDDGNTTPATIQFAQPSYIGSEGGGNTTVTISRSGNLAGASTVQFYLSSGTAIAGQDFASSTPTSVTFAANETSKTVSLTATDDTLIEPTEFAFLRLGTPTNATLGTQDVALWQIQDNDFAPTVQFSQTTFSVNEGAANVTITLVRTGTLTASSQVHLKITGGSATAGQDYDNSGFPLNVTFAANESVKTVPIPIINYTAIEPTELFLFELASVSNVTLGTQDFTALRILDNDSLNSNSTTLAVGTVRGDEDILISGTGQDRLIGNLGKDRFIYTAIQDGIDTIKNFDVKEDKIDFSQIFDNTAYRSSIPFSDYVRLTRLGSNTAVQIDPNGDVFSTKFETLIILKDVLPAQLTASNFVL